MPAEIQLLACGYEARCSERRCIARAGPIKLNDNEIAASTPRPPTDDDTAQPSDSVEYRSEQPRCRRLTRPDDTAFGTIQDEREMYSEAGQ